MGEGGGEGVRTIGEARSHHIERAYPSPYPSPEGERLSFAVMAHDRRGDRMQPRRICLDLPGKKEAATLAGFRLRA
jgi:hypothetical protein